MNMMQAQFKHTRLALFLAGLAIIGSLFGWPLLTSAQQPSRDELPPALISFTVDLTAVAFSAVELGTAKATLAWQAIGMTTNYRLQLYFFQNADWATYPNWPDNAPATASAQLPILPTRDFAPPMYRMAILNRSGQIISQQIVAIPYDATQPGTPTITAFTSDVPSISSGTLSSGNALVGVSWKVENRIPFSNLTFHQILPDGREAIAELARPLRWIDSTGQGPLRVAPVGDSAGSVRLRLRVIDVRDNRVYGETILNIPIVTGRNVQPTIQTTPTN